jgi:hypothetical protein
LLRWPRKTSIKQNYKIFIEYDGLLSKALRERRIEVQKPYAKRGNVYIELWLLKSISKILSINDESGVDNFRIRSDPNPNYVDMEKSF